MAYSEELAQRVRDAVGPGVAIEEKKMFGGLCVLVNGNMACGVMDDEIMVRVGPDGYEEALALPHARVMDFTGRPMKGFISVDPEGIATDDGLADWVGRGVEFAGSLPPKEKKAEKGNKGKKKATGKGATS